MEILRSLDEMREWRASLAPDQRVGFVPTMGNLHKGHIELINAAKQRSDVVVASIFVNPMQFGGNEKPDAYPRTLEADLAKLKAAGAAAVFTPRTAEIYPDGISLHTAVEVPGLTDVLCGASRPGHFRGVTTVVSKLLGTVRPHIAAFGAKDLQQVLIIKKMVHDLSINTEIDVVPTVRETDGLAMSSRNSFLSHDERALAQASQAAYQAELSAAGLRQITTEILPMPSYYLAEAYHQQYLHKNPNGYCGLGGTGVSCPLPALKP